MYFGKSKGFQEKGFWMKKYIHLCLGSIHIQLLGEVVVHGGEVGGGEGAGGEGDQEPRLADLAIPAHHTFDASHCVTLIMFSLQQQLTH